VRVASLAPRWVLFCAALLGLLIGCADKSRSDVACTFGQEHRVAVARGSFGGVRVVQWDETFVAVWTESLGTFVRTIDMNGRPVEAAQRIGIACEGGVDAVATPSGLSVVCIHPPMPQADKPGQIELIAFDRALAVTDRRIVGSVGRTSRGVSVADGGDGALVVAHDDGEERAVFVTRVTPDRPPRQQRISREGPTPGPPHVFADEDRLLVTWAETITDPTTDALVGEVLVFEPGGAESEPSRFATVIYDDAQPRLSRDTEGWVLGFRDEYPAGTRVALFTARLGPGLEKAGDLSRIGRSDAASGAALFPCAGGLYTVAPHSYGRREVLVGVSRLDTSLESIAGEHQIYTSGTEYVHGTGLCAGDAALILVAERAPTPTDDATLKAVTLTCAR
jgi:hypothetical protein